nr:solute carrier family 23 protein [uncultured Rhodoferax sp.]
MPLLARLASRLPASTPRRRPFELIYASDELPPLGALGVLALQHAATVLAFVAYVLAAAKIAGLSVPQTSSVVALTLLAMGTITVLQAWGGRWGSGSLLVFQPDPMMITIAGAAIAASGVGALVEVTLIVAVVTMVAGPLIGKLRPLFPPTVVGTVVCMAGLGLIEQAVTHSLGLDAQKQINGTSALISGAALASIVACSVWGGRRLKLLGMLAGIAVGMLIAIVSRQLVGLEWVQVAPVLALPERIAPSFTLSPSMVGAIALITLLNQLDNIGCLSMMERSDNADWRRADMGVISRGIRANGLGDLLAGMFGSFPTAPCSANIALAHATRSTSRYIGLATGALLLLIAMSPKLTMALTLIPTAVLGAVEVYAAAYLLVSGIEMIASRALDSRGIFMVGLSLCAGLATMLMPELGRQAPYGLHVLLTDGFVVTGATVVVLNLVFRLGVRQHAASVLDGGHGAVNQQITDFVDAQGAAWSARSEVVRRAASAALEATEAIAAAGCGKPLEVRGNFDEFNFVLELVHAGDPLVLAADEPLAEMSAEALWEADDQAWEAAVAHASSRLIFHLADRVSSARCADGRALLRLHFEH